MGSSVHSLFLQSNLLSGRMALKAMIILCLVVVGYIEANPVPDNYDLDGGTLERKINSPELTEEDIIPGDGGTLPGVDTVITIPSNEKDKRSPDDYQGFSCNKVFGCD